MIKKPKTPHFVIGLLCVLNFLIRLPFSNLPAHHDEHAYFDGVLKVFQNNLNPFVEFWSYKPPFLFEITAILFKLFSPAIEWGRLVIFFFSSLSLFFTYLLGKQLFSEKVGIFSAILLFFFPLFMAQSFLFHAAVPLTALTLMSLYFYFNGDKLWYFLSAVFLVLTKEPAVLIIFLIALFDICKRYNGKNTSLVLKRSLFILCPLLFFIGWLGMNKLVFGWYLWPYNVSYFTSKPPYVHPELTYLTNMIFKEYLLWFIFSLLIGGFVFSLAWPKLRKGFFKREILFFNVVFLVLTVFFFRGAFLPRYFLLGYPLIFLCFTWLLQLIFSKKKVLFVGLVLLICFGFFVINVYHLFFYPKIPQWQGERDLSFLRFVYLQKKSTDFVVDNYPEAIVISVWPITDILEDPFWGYVKEGRKSFTCKTKEDKKILEQTVLKRKKDHSILMIFYLWEEGPWRCFEKDDFDLVKKIGFERFPRSKQIEIYLLKGSGVSI